MGFNRNSSIENLAVALPYTSHTTRRTTRACATTALSLCLSGSASVSQHSSRGWAGNWDFLGKGLEKGGALRAPGGFVLMGEDFSKSPGDAGGAKIKFIFADNPKV